MVVSWEVEKASVFWRDPSMTETIVPARLCAARTIGCEVDGLVEGTDEGMGM